MSNNHLERIVVHPDGRFLMTESGSPFFWLADTAWEMFHRLTDDEAVNYLANRAEKGFTVIQAVALAEFNGLNAPNTSGDLPLIDLDPTRPNEAYFARVDRMIRAAEAVGLYIALLPTWGDKVVQGQFGGPAVFTAENAAIYGEWLGRRYANQTNILWVLGGDRPVEHDGLDDRPVYHAMAAGIDRGTSGKAFMTFHPCGGVSSSAWLHAETWLDMNMMQSGHGSGHDVANWDMIAVDYQRLPVKPVVDGEPNYEDHPVNPWPTWDPANGYYRDHDVRKQLYRSVLAGGCGVTYGHHSIWQFLRQGYEPVNHPDRDYFDALNRPGASQVKYLRRLIESRPFFSRVPDQSLIASAVGEKGEHIQASRGNGYAIIYLPEARPVSVNPTAVGAVHLHAWWYDPQTGSAVDAGLWSGETVINFTPPAGGPDWVLVLDNASLSYPPPGSGSFAV